MREGADTYWWNCNKFCTISRLNVECVAVCAAEKKISMASEFMDCRVFDNLAMLVSSTLTSFSSLTSLSHWMKSVVGAAPVSVLHFVRPYHERVCVYTHQLTKRLTNFLGEWIAINTYGYILQVCAVQCSAFCNCFTVRGEHWRWDHIHVCPFFIVSRFAQKYIICACVPYKIKVIARTAERVVNGLNDIRDIGV